MSKGDKIYIEPIFCYEGQEAFLLISGTATAVTVVMAAGETARVKNEEFNIDKLVNIRELRIIKLLSPADQLKRLGWGKLDKSGKMVWMRPECWTDRLDAKIKPVTLETACEMAGIYLT